MIRNSERKCFMIEAIKGEQISALFQLSRLFFEDFYRFHSFRMKKKLLRFLSLSEDNALKILQIHCFVFCVIIWSHFDILDYFTWSFFALNFKSFCLIHCYLLHQKRQIVKSYFWRNLASIGPNSIVCTYWEPYLFGFFWFFIISMLYTNYLKN